VKPDNGRADWVLQTAEQLDGEIRQPMSGVDAPAKLLLYGSGII